ncbi:MAG: Coenzyme F420 hydrogenase/dehydrogenase, beta subunit C-terminal domain [Acidimicrobiales bacterium]
MAATESSAPAKKERWTYQWKELFEEVITSGLCTGCAGCVISCPHDVIGYEHEPGAYRPFHLEEELGIDDCIHGQKGCTSCTRACPRFRMWDPEADAHLFGREREPAEMAGIYSDILLTRASDDFVYETGQDGGLVSAILIWCLENDIIDGALTSGVENLPNGEPGWKAFPMVATNREEVLRGAGSRYTYSANTIAYDDARERGARSPRPGGDELSDLGRAGHVAPQDREGVEADQAQHRPALLEVVRRLVVRRAVRGQVRCLARENIAKMNIKGVFQIWTKDGGYHEINLKGECHAWTREGCHHCPDFAAEHADISTGGIGDATDWTLTIVRTELGRAVIDAMVKDGVIETRPGDDDPGAIALLHKLAQKSRRALARVGPACGAVGISGKAG